MASETARKDGSILWSAAVLTQVSTVNIAPSGFNESVCALKPTHHHPDGQKFILTSRVNMPPRKVYLHTIDSGYSSIPTCYLEVYL